MKRMQQMIATSLFVTLWTSSVFAQAGPGWDHPDAIPTEAANIIIKDKVDITVEIPGKIKDLTPGFVGGRVKADDTVITLHSETVQAELAELRLQAESDVLINFAVASLNVAQENLDQKLATNKEFAERKGFNGIPMHAEEEIRLLRLETIQAQAEVDKSTQDKDAAGLKLKTKETALDQYTVKAPMDGVVTDLHSKAKGAGVRQGDPIMTIINLAEVTARMEIDRDYESLVTVGDTVILRQTGGPGQAAPSKLNGSIKTSTHSKPQLADSRDPETPAVFEAKIVFIVPTIEPSNSSLKVDAIVTNRFENNKYVLREGSTVEAIIIPSSKL